MIEPRGFAYVWEFRVAPENRERFEAVYGPEGDWVKLFRRDPDYRGTDLLHDADRPGRYLTIDHWTSRAARDAFRARFADDFAALDAACAELTAEERNLGDFDLR